MLTGRVRFFDADKGSGFITKDEGDDALVRAGALPKGATSLRSGQKVEFGVTKGRHGEQALSVRLVEAPLSLSKASRKKAQDMVVTIEDLIKMLDTLGDGYRHGRYPDGKHGMKIAVVPRHAADKLEL